MNLTKDTNNATFQIRSYGPGSVTVNDNVYHRSLIVSSSELITDWRPQSLQEFTPQDWSVVITLKPEIILFGVGGEFKMPHSSVLAPLYQAKIPVECMTTGAACRTYMALTSENRRAAAALIIESNGRNDG